MSTLSVNTIKDVQSFDFANTSFASAFGVANAGFGKANTALQNTTGTFEGSLYTTGKIGIGTNSIASNQILKVWGGRSGLVANSDPYALGISHSTVSGNDYCYIGATSGATPSMVFSNAGGAELMRIDSSGSMGIGTPSPSTKLHVYGAGDPIITSESSQAGQAGQFKAVGKGSNSYPGYNLAQDSTGYWSIQMRADTNLYFYRQNGSGNVMVPSAGVYASIFYDYDNTSFYINPNGNSTTAGQILIGPNSYGRYTRFGLVGPATDEATIAASNGNLHIDCKEGYALYLNYSATGTINMCQGGGYTYSAGSMRSPIFYDSDNTGYYCDPASTTQLSVLYLGGSRAGYPTYTLYSSSYAVNTWYTAPENLVVTISLQGSYMNGLRVYAGPTTSTYYNIMEWGDDINSNTKSYGGSFIIKKGACFYFESPGPYAYAFETIRLYTFALT